jgi:hypothetical protein
VVTETTTIDGNTVRLPASEFPIGCIGGPGYRPAGLHHLLHRGPDGLVSCRTKMTVDPGKLDCILGFNYSIYINLTQAKLDPDKDARWLSYSDHGLDLCSNGVMALPFTRPGGI